MFYSAPFALALLASVSAKTINVDVGLNGLTYSPSSTSAEIGDQVVFHFHPANHTVTETTFATVCQPKEGGFDTGFNPVAANQTDNLPTMTFPVNDMDPHWFYCKQAAGTPNSHCGKGMIFAINCPSTGTNTFANFQAAALAVGAELTAAAASSASASSTDPSYPSATSTDSSVAPTSTDTGSNTVHQVLVGPDGQFAFSPSNITAQPGDILSFLFQLKNHTVTQSSFLKPCNKLTDNTTGAVIAIDSGFVPVDANDTAVHTFNVTVNATTPLWFYCRQHKPDGSSHCGSGMVFSVNANESSDHSFEAFKALALKLNGTDATNTSNSNSTNGSSGNVSGASTSTVLSTAVSLGAALFGAALLL